MQYSIHALLIGAGATLVMDLWSISASFGGDWRRRGQLPTKITAKRNVSRQDRQDAKEEKKVDNSEFQNSELQISKFLPWRLCVLARVISSV
jgi:hypothetical protein